jgi:hypothetical protein
MGVSLGIIEPRPGLVREQSDRLAKGEQHRLDTRGAPAPDALAAPVGLPGPVTGRSRPLRSRPRRLGPLIAYSDRGRTFGGPAVDGQPFEEHRRTQEWGLSGRCRQIFVPWKLAVS